MFLTVIVFNVCHTIYDCICFTDHQIFFSLIKIDIDGLKYKNSRGEAKKIEGWACEVVLFRLKGNWYLLNSQIYFIKSKSVIEGIIVFRGYNAAKDSKEILGHQCTYESQAKSQ